MAKNAVYSIQDNHDLSRDYLIKRAALMFDKIYIKKPMSFSENCPSIFKPIRKSIKKIDEDKALYEYLCENQVVFPIDFSVSNMRVLEHKIGRLFYKRWDVHLRQVARALERLKEAETIKESDEIRGKFNEALYKSTDMQTRYESIYLRNAYQEEFYPILKSSESFLQPGKKTEVIQMILKNMPQPDDSNLWEAIINFRNDESIRIKYLALINWINDISTTALTINEISEKLEYLYLDYKRNFERHKLKTKMGILEILTAAGASFFSSNLPAALNLVSNMIKVGVIRLNLFQEENNLPGKEISYIYHAKEVFNA